MPTIKGFFFDLDGTLVNTYEADYRAYRDAIVEVTGHNIGRDAFMATNGQAMNQKLDSLLPRVDEDQRVRIAKAKKKHYPKYVGRTVPNEMLIRFLAAWTPHHTTALVTTAQRQNAELVLAAHNLTSYFDIIICGNDVQHPKPDPEGYLLALKRSGLHASEVVAFEDSASGITAAEVAGLAVIPVKDFA